MASCEASNPPSIAQRNICEKREEQSKPERINQSATSLSIGYNFDRSHQRLNRIQIA